MFNRIKNFVAYRREKNSQPWNKKQKIVFVVVLAAMAIYVIISLIINSMNAAPASEQPRETTAAASSETSGSTFNLKINTFDIVILCAGVGYFVVREVRNVIKEKKK